MPEIEMSLLLVIKQCLRDAAGCRTSKCDSRPREYSRSPAAGAVTDAEAPLSFAIAGGGKADHGGAGRRRLARVSSLLREGPRGLWDRIHFEPAGCAARGGRTRYEVTGGMACT